MCRSYSSTRLCIFLVASSVFVLATHTSSIAQEGQSDSENESYYAERVSQRIAHLRSGLLSDDGELTPEHILKAHEAVQRMHQQQEPGVVGGLPVGTDESFNGLDVRQEYSLSNGQFQFATATAALGLSLTSAPGVAHPSFTASTPATGPHFWTSLGPGNIGGVVSTIVVKPPVATHGPMLTVWAGSWYGGILKTDDGGTTWQSVANTMATQAVSCMVLDPSDSAHETLFVGTGSFADRPGVGIYKTYLVNQKRVWKRLQATLGFHYVYDLAIDSSGQVLYAATEKGLQISRDGGDTWAVARINGTNGPLLSIPMYKVSINTGNEQQLLASSTDGGRLFYSEDGGSTWYHSHFPHSERPIEARQFEPLADDNRCYRNFSLCYSSQGTYAYAGAAYFDHKLNRMTIDVLRSSDGGKTFANMASRSLDSEVKTIDCYPLWTHGIWANDPSNEDVVVLGGVLLWRSDNGGSTFSLIADGDIEHNAHADHHVIVSNPANPREALIGCDGGVYHASDITTATKTSGWDRYFTKGFNFTEFYYGDANGHGQIIGGTQDNGSMIYDASATDAVNNWTKVLGGDGGFPAADRSNSKYFYCQWQWFGLFRYYRDTVPQLVMINGNDYKNPRQAPWLIPDAVQTDSQSKSEFYAPLVFDPHGNRLLAGGQSLWQCNNPRASYAGSGTSTTAGPSWSQLAPPRTDNPNIGTIAAGKNNLVLVGYNPGYNKTTKHSMPMQLWKYQNGTPTRIDNPAQDPIDSNRYWGCVAIDPKHQDNFYATFKGYSADNVWKSTDGGSSWNSISEGLPEAPMNWITVSPLNSSHLYVASDAGLFVSVDGGTTWSVNSEGPVDVPVKQVFWNNHKLVAATFGRGMWEIDPVKNIPVGMISATANAVYAIDPSSGDVWQRTSSATRWTHVGYAVNSITAATNSGSHDVLAVINRDQGNAWKWKGTGDQYDPLDTSSHDVSQLAVFKANTFKIDTNGNVFKYGSGTWGSTISAIPGQKFTSLAVQVLGTGADDYAVWGITEPDNLVRRYSGSGSSATSWPPIGSNITVEAIAASDSNSSIYVIGKKTGGNAHKIFHYDASLADKWQDIGRGASAISATNNSLYLINVDSRHVFLISNASGTHRSYHEICTTNDTARISAAGGKIYRMDINNSVWIYDELTSQWKALGVPAKAP